MLLGFLDPRRRGDRDFRCQEIVTTTTGRSGMAPSNYPSFFLLSLSLFFIYIYSKNTIDLFLARLYYNQLFNRLFPIAVSTEQRISFLFLSLSFSISSLLTLSIHFRSVNTFAILLFYHRICFNRLVRTCSANLYITTRSFDRYSSKFLLTNSNRGSKGRKGIQFRL